MTKLIAKLREFSLITNGGAEESFRFRIGFCDEFQTTLSEFRAAIPETDRRYDGRFWTVKASHSGAMAALFDNFAELYQSARTRMPRR